MRTRLGNNKFNNAGFINTGFINTGFINSGSKTHLRKLRWVNSGA
jgi:hypothetical protein